MTVPSPLLGRQDWRTNVVVIGSGVAGLACALALAPTPVMVVTKTAGPAGGSSPLAQGGIAAALGPGDSPVAHAADTVGAGAGLTDPAMALLLAREGAAAVRRLIDGGAPFDRDADGTVQLGREAAHGQPRIVHAGGDATGRNLIQSLLQRVQETPSIRVVAESFVVELLTQRGWVTGVLALHRRLGWIRIHANAVVLATGGIGSLWRETTNPAEATGDGLALAARSGARLADLEFVQFHPTALVPRRRGDGSRLALLTEALRGAGAVLLDRDGRRFMADEHPLAELAPRDVVARAIARRSAEGAAVFLDLRPALARAGEAAFPQALTLCRREGYEPLEAPVPIAPAAHYHMGGVLTDADGRTGVAGLWACGETACTGVHGANRLASNSLLEGLVFGERVAASVRATATRALPSVSEPAPALPRAAVDLDQLADLRSALRDTLARHVGLVRDGEGLARAERNLADLDRTVDALAAEGPPTAEPDFATLMAWGELRNMLLVGRLVARAAAGRTESRGAHCRTDHPEPSAAWQRRQVFGIESLMDAAAAGPHAPVATTTAC
jgi:L-aspartate oxidase